MCNLSYAVQRAELVAALAMADPKDRLRALEGFDEWVNGPAEGWDEADRRVLEQLSAAG